MELRQKVWAVKRDVRERKEAQRQQGQVIGRTERRGYEEEYVRMNWLNDEAWGVSEMYLEDKMELEEIRKEPRALKGSYSTISLLEISC